MQQAESEVCSASIVLLASAVPQGALLAGLSRRWGMTGPSGSANLCYAAVFGKHWVTVMWRE